MKQAHIMLDESLGIRYALMPGDPGRIRRVGEHLENVRRLENNREFLSIRGSYKGVDVLAISTGIGGCSAGIAAAAVRDDGASKAYVPDSFPACANRELLNCCGEAAGSLGAVWHEGIVHSHESFYHEENEAQSAYWSSKGVLGADMETAAIYTIAGLRGLKAASILNNVVLYGQDTADSIGDYVQGAQLAQRGETLEILTALEAFALFDRKEKSK